MIKDRVENLDVSVYARTVSGKTINVKRQKTKCNSNKRSSGKKDIDPKRLGKVLNDKKTKEESIIEAGATIETSLRIMGGMEKEELMETSETEEEIKKRKLMELSESKPSRLSEDAVYLRKEIINAIERSDEKMENLSKRTEEQMESYSKTTDEKMDNFLQPITSSVGLQVRGTNSTIEKMKDEGDDRYNRIDERIGNMEKKFSMIEEASTTKTGEYNKVQEDQNHGKAVATGFHGDSTEQEVEQLLRETIAEIGMSTESVKIKCQTYHICFHIFQRQR